MTKKMTKKEMYAVVINVVASSEYENKAEMVAFLEHEVELLSRKSAKAGLTKTQKENIEISETIKVVLAESEAPMTVSALMADSRLATYSSQKLSALLKPMVEAGTVVRTVEKKKAFYSVA